MKVKWVPLTEVLRPDANPVAVDAVGRYRSAGLLNRGRGLFAKPDLAGEDTSYRTLNRLREGQVVYSKLFGWEGAIAVVPREYADFHVSSEFPTFSVEHDQVSVRFLEQVLKSPNFSREIAMATTGLGQRRQRVNPADFLALLVPLPPRRDQDRIAEYLSSLERASTAGQDDVVAWNLVSSAFDQAPVKLAEVVEVQSRDVPIESDVVYAMSGVKWYGQGLFEREHKLGRDLSASRVRRVAPGDLVYNRLFAWKQSFALAVEWGWVSKEFPTFTVDSDRVLPRVLLEALLSPDFTAAVNAASTGTTPTSRNRLKEADFLDLTVRLPRPAQQDVVARALTAFDRMARVRERRSNLTAALLPAARNEVFSAMV